MYASTNLETVDMLSQKTLIKFYAVLAGRNECFYQKALGVSSFKAPSKIKRPRKAATLCLGLC